MLQLDWLPLEASQSQTDRNAEYQFFVGTLTKQIINSSYSWRMNSFKSQTHHCQIDCTNHDEVINGLEIKSKDLYYFWRNYEWLYNRYYSQQNKHEEPTVSTRELEEEIARLESQNKMLRIENQSYKKQIQAQTHGANVKIEQDYKKEIDRLTAKCRDYESIRERLTEEITSLKNRLRQYQQNAEDTETKHRREIKRQETIIIELQQNIDEIRAKMLKGTGDSQGQAHEKYRREMHKVKVLMSSLEQQSNQILEEQMENLRVELLNEFPQMFTSFSRGNLNGIVVEQIDEE